MTRYLAGKDTLESEHSCGKKNVSWYCVSIVCKWDYIAIRQERHSQVWHRSCVDGSSIVKCGTGCGAAVRCVGGQDVGGRPINSPRTRNSSVFRKPKECISTDCGRDLNFLTPK